MSRSLSEPTLRTLANELVMDLSALSHTLKPLVRDGLIKIVPDEERRACQARHADAGWPRQARGDVSALDRSPCALRESAGTGAGREAPRHARCHRFAGLCQGVWGARRSVISARVFTISDREQSDLKVLLERWHLCLIVSPNNGGFDGAVYVSSRGWRQRPPRWLLARPQAAGPS